MDPLDRVDPEGAEVTASDKFEPIEAAGGSLRAQMPASDRLPLAGRFLVTCHGADGALKWTEDIPNLVTTVGVNDLWGKYFSGSAYTATWFVGLKGTGSAANSDTMASHAGWSEVTSYSQATRPAFTAGTPASRAVDNSLSLAVFSINGTVTVAGMFLSSSSTKSGTTGILFNATDFSVSRALISGDTLSVQYTISA